MLKKNESWGKFIVLEGIDGSGTTTMAKRLCEELDAVYTNEPTSGPIGQLIRAYLRGDVGIFDELWKPDAETMALLYVADRVDHQKLIKSHLSSGRTVICDRYHYSTLAYQSATSERADLKVFSSWLYELARYCVEPDLVVVLDIGGQEAEARRLARHEKQEVFEVSELQKKLAEVYRMFPAMEFQHHITEGRAPRSSYMNIPNNFSHVNASLSENEVFEQCLAVIAEKS